MDSNIRDLLKALFAEFEMDDGEWPGINVFSTSYGRVWGTLPDQVVEILQELQQLVDEESDD